MHPSAVTDHSGLGKSYTYDPNGNMLTRGNQTLTWDIDNRVLSISIAGGGTTSMEYDYSGTRVKKSAPGGITLYPFAGYEIDPNGVVTKYIRIGDESVASKRGASKYFYHNDHLGSVNVVTDINGSRVQLLEYDPWGAISRSEGTLDPDQRFTGQKLDPETGLYYYGGRYYDAEIGRFISADPFVQSPFDPQNLNRYSYVLNSPQNYIDPDGYFHKIKKKKGGFFRSFFGFFVGAIVAVLTGGAGGAPLWVAAVTGATVGGAVNAALNGGNPFLAGLMGGFTAGLLGGLMPPGFESPALGSAAAASHLGVFASSFAPGMGGGSHFTPGLQLAQASGAGCDVCSDSDTAWDILRVLWGLVQPNDALAGGADDEGGGRTRLTPRYGVIQRVPVSPAGRMAEIWNNPRLFRQWLHVEQSAKRIGNPLTVDEAKRVIDQALKLGIPKKSFDFNPAGLAGRETTGMWKDVPHFKIGPTHIPVDPGFTPPW